MSIWGMVPSVALTGTVETSHATSAKVVPSRKLTKLSPRGTQAQTGAGNTCHFSKSGAFQQAHDTCHFSQKVATLQEPHEAVTMAHTGADRGRPHMPLQPKSGDSPGAHKAVPMAQRGRWQLRCGEQRRDRAGAGEAEAL